MLSWGVAVGSAFGAFLVGLVVGRLFSSGKSKKTDQTVDTRLRSRIRELETERDELVQKHLDSRHEEAGVSEEAVTAARKLEEELVMERAAHEGTLKELEDVRALLEQYRDSSIPGPPVAPYEKVVEREERADPPVPASLRRDPAMRSTSQTLQQIKDTLGAEPAARPASKPAKDKSGARDSAPFGDGALFTQTIRPTKIDPHRKRFARVEVFVKDTSGKLLPAARVEGFISSQGGRGMMDRWVIRSVVKTVSFFSTEARKDIQGFVIPLCRTSVEDPNMEGYIREQLSRFDVAGSGLVLEVPQSVIEELPERFAEFAEGVKSLGCLLAVGGLYPGSEITTAMLELQFDYACFEPGAEADLERDPELGMMIERFVSAAKEAGMQIIAWGVESRGVFQYLQSVGADYVQGRWVEGPIQLREMGGASGRRR